MDVFKTGGSQPVGHGNILKWATELFKKMLDLLKNSVSFVSLWLSLHLCLFSSFDGSNNESHCCFFATDR